VDRKHLGESDTARARALGAAPSFFVTALLLLASTTTAQAAGPIQIGYQGRLFDATGTAPLTEIVSLTFGIYAPNSSGLPANDCLLYEETQSNIDLSITNGLFSVEIGSNTGRPEELGA
jgi:hypothetical protein